MIPDPYLRDRSDADGLVEGYFLLRRARRVDVPVHIWFGPPNDPETGEILDRSWRWQIEVNGIDASDTECPALVWGRPVESLLDVWPQCARFPTDRADYRYRVDRAEWAEQYDLNDPFGSKFGRIDPLTTTLPFL